MFRGLLVSTNYFDSSLELRFEKPGCGDFGDRAASIQLLSSTICIFTEVGHGSRPAEGNVVFGFRKLHNLGKTQPGRTHQFHVPANIAELLVNAAPSVFASSGVHGVRLGGQRDPEMVL